MKRVEIVTPKGEVLWVGDKDGMSLSMHGVIDDFQLTVREVREVVEFEATLGGVLYGKNCGEFVAGRIEFRETIPLHHTFPIGRKVRVRVECVE